MTQILYIDLNSELAPHENFVKQFFEDHVPKEKYRFATEEEYEGLTCVTNVALLPKSLSFRKISCEYLYSILNNVFHSKSISRQEQIEAIRMCLSKDNDSRVLGISLLSKFAFPKLDLNFLSIYIKELACYILSENEIASDFARMYRLAFARDHFKNMQIRFFKSLLGVDKYMMATKDVADHYIEIRRMVLDYYGLMDKK